MIDSQNDRGQELTAVALTRKKDSLWPDRFSDSDELALRTHRAISWISRAEQESDDYDAVFIFYWIAFNAAYAQEIQGTQEIAERSRLREYFKRLIRLDTESRIFDAVWNMFSDSIRILLENRYVFQPFWQHHNGVLGYDDWESRFQASRTSVARAEGLIRKQCCLIFSTGFMCYAIR